MTIQVVIKFQISNFEFLGVPQEKSLGRPHIKNPKNIFFKSILQNLCKKSDPLAYPERAVYPVAGPKPVWRTYRPVPVLCRTCVRGFQAATLFNVLDLFPEFLQLGLHFHHGP